MTTEEKLKLAQRMFERHQQQEAREEREHVPRLLAASMHKEAARAPQDMTHAELISTQTPVADYGVDRRAL